MDAGLSILQRLLLGTMMILAVRAVVQFLSRDSGIALLVLLRSSIMWALLLGASVIGLAIVHWEGRLVGLLFTKALMVLLLSCLIYVCVRYVTGVRVIMMLNWVRGLSFGVFAGSDCWDVVYRVSTLFVERLTRFVSGF